MEGTRVNDRRILHSFDSHESLAKEMESTEWTDEKHSRYLKYMETSFVDQLYKSIDLGSCSHNDVSSRSMHLRSGEFKVHRGGCWDTINFGCRRSSSTQPDSILKSPWIQHFRSSNKSMALPATPLQTLPPSTTSRTQHSGYSHVEDAVAEVSDQNFVDEHNKKQSKSQRYTSKRMKTAKNAANKDQVVPRRKRQSS